MPAPVRTSGSFTYADWREEDVTDRESLPRLARARVVNAFSGGIEAAATTCEYTIVYVTDKTGTFTGLQLFAGSVDGRPGAFAAEERGSFTEDGTLCCAFEVVRGSGTGALEGLSGKGHYRYVPGEESITYSFEYDLER